MQPLGTFKVLENFISALVILLYEACKSEDLSALVVTASGCIYNIKIEIGSEESS